MCKLGWLPVTFVVTRWGDPRRLVNAAAGVVTTRFDPGLVVRPGRSGLANDASEERTGLALLELMLS